MNSASTYTRVPFLLLSLIAQPTERNDSRLVSDSQDSVQLLHHTSERIDRSHTHANYHLIMGLFVFPSTTPCTFYRSHASKLSLSFPFSRRRHVAPNEPSSGGVYVQSKYASWIRNDDIHSNPHFHSWIGIAGCRWFDTGNVQS